MLTLITSWRRWLGPVLLVIVAFGFRSAHYSENYGHPDETITVEGAGASTRTFKVVGTFKLNRISPIATLTR